MRHIQATLLVLALSSTSLSAQAIDWRSLSFSSSASSDRPAPRQLISSNPRKRPHKRWRPWPLVPRFPESSWNKFNPLNGIEMLLVHRGEHLRARQDNAPEIISSAAAWTNGTSKAGSDPWDSWDDLEEGMECSWMTCEEGEPGCLEFDETNDPLDQTGWVEAAAAVVEDTQAYLDAGGVMWGLWLGPEGLFLDSKATAGELGTSVVANDTAGIDDTDDDQATDAATDVGAESFDSGSDNDAGVDDGSGDDGQGDDAGNESTEEVAPSEERRRGWRDDGKYQGDEGADEDGGDDGDDGGDYSSAWGSSKNSKSAWDHGGSGKGDKGDEGYGSNGRDRPASSYGYSNAEEDNGHSGYSKGDDSHSKGSTQVATSQHGSSVLQSASTGSSSSSDDCGALAQLYHSLGGTSWTLSTDWGSGSCCGWYGITCMAGRVQKISLAKNGLTGSVPEPLFSLKALVSIDISGNDIDLGQADQYDSLAHLAHFAASNCSLSGSVPASLLTSDSLVTLDLSGNRLTGTVAIASSRIQMIDLGQNALTGITFSSSAKALTRVYLGDNQLGGQLPSLPSSLQYLDMSNNHLDISPSGETTLIARTGPIPSLSTITNLQHLDLRSNQLSGSISDLSLLTHLTALYLGNNSLSGSLGAAPPSLTSCSILPNNFDTCQESQQNGTLAAACHVQCHASSPITPQGIPVQALPGENLQPAPFAAASSETVSPQAGSPAGTVSHGPGMPNGNNIVSQQSGGGAGRPSASAQAAPNQAIGDTPKQGSPVAMPQTPAQLGLQSPAAQVPQMGPESVALHKPGGVVMTAGGRRGAASNSMLKTMLLLSIGFIANAI